MEKKVIYDMPDISKTEIMPLGACGMPACMSYYELVYMLDAAHKYAFIFGGSKACRAADVEINGSVHEKHHNAALAGAGAIYEWSSGGKDYRTALIPLGCGQVTNVLGLVKELPRSRGPANMVRDIGAKTFSQALLKTREDEKKKIAGALHDEIGTTAVILTSILSILESDIKEDKKTDALRRAKEMDVKIKESVERLKNLIVTMRPPSIDAVGLEGAVKELVGNLNQVSPVKIKYVYEEEDGGAIDDEVKIMLYRVIQESLNNALKHAKAQNINVTLQNLKNLVKIEVKDDGRGFKKAEKPTLSHLGLPGMKDSVSYLGGQFKIKTDLGKGTVVAVSCPKVIYKVEL
ncbi:MAG: sensor histidine kinase [Elusimicrobium sp.]|jgi:signal transduction histidine kinase|nr:sensor histidine kinase [Elusimicrobium sp.]